MRVKVNAGLQWMVDELAHAICIKLARSSYSGVKWVCTLHKCFLFPGFQFTVAQCAAVDEVECGWRKSWNELHFQCFFVQACLQGSAYCGSMCCVVLAQILKRVFALHFQCFIFQACLQSVDRMTGPAYCGSLCCSGFACFRIQILKQVFALSAFCFIASLVWIECVDRMTGPTYCGVSGFACFRI